MLLVALTFAIAALSWEHIENPIRTHGFRGALDGSDRATGAAFTPDGDRRGRALRSRSRNW